MDTPQSKFRFSKPFIALLDRLQARLGVTSRADVIRIAVTRLAEAEKGGKKTSAKSAKGG